MELGDVVKLQNGYRGVIIGTPKTFMSGGSYEVEYTNENGVVKRKWVKPEEILYTIDEKTEDDINNYFEIMFDDLNEEAQKRFLEFLGLDNAEDGNFDIAPLAIFDFEQEVEL